MGKYFLADKKGTMTKFYAGSNRKIFFFHPVPLFFLAGITRRLYYK